VALGVTPVACQGISLLTATPNRPGPARNLFRFRDQDCSHFMITNTILYKRSMPRRVHQLRSRNWAAEAGEHSRYRPTNPSIKGIG